MQIITINGQNYRMGCFLPVWKVIQIGTLKNQGEHRDALYNVYPIKLEDCVIPVFMKSPNYYHLISQRVKEVALCRITIEELTGKDRPSTEEIYNCLEKAGGQILPADTAAHLCLHCKNIKSKKNQWSIIISEPIIDHCENPCLFIVCNKYKYPKSVKYDPLHHSIHLNTLSLDEVWMGHHTIVFGI